MTCYSNGKFLITGEYLVLHGALALAVPLRFGQSLQVLPSATTGNISWKSYVENSRWFEAVYALPGFAVNSTNDEARAHYLAGLLRAAHHLNPQKLELSNGYEVMANINFNLNWGLGSSSTLIANIAGCFDIDPFDLHFAVSEGSGYDIACASANSPLLYQLINKQPLIERTPFKPKFSKNIYFVYLGKKQDSAKSIRNFSGKTASAVKEIALISSLTKEIATTNSLDEFDRLIAEHEHIVSAVLGIPTLKQTLFRDFEGEMKSLGAWGGDFMMVTWRDDSDRLKQYLAQKGYNTVFGYNEIVLQPKDGETKKDKGIAKNQFSLINKTE
jgi:mevalonate kinase